MHTNWFARKSEEKVVHEVQMLHVMKEEEAG